ncbi:hypothetical protein ADN00_08825 [Ornatilinea apprima]|uniref:Uncharacterized protein n=1 Tax=Ornatilinea apprima TaxID=1134406 RepID=A0A0P6XQZ1_9CHLR|nr:hypothetical protein [Ornatilinea apprima]KPL77678.1 hypothetical protein ADN00_08825 [Ornatilinea apprima]
MNPLRARRWWLAAAAGLMLACQLPLLGASLPEVIEHPAPDLRVDFSPFEAAGCQKDDSGWIRCPQGSPLDKLGCATLQPASDLLGGLQPADPIAVCVVRQPDEMDDETFEQQESVYRVGGLFPVLYRYVIWRDGGFILLANQQAVQQAFAPIESPQEALSYALALTNLDADYDLQASRGMRYFTDTLEETHVQETSGGYAMNLFRYQFLGCGPHPTYQVIVTVGRDGSISQGEPVKWFENPEEDGLCAD